jgi:hypothetical protein
MLERNSNCTVGTEQRRHGSLSKRYGCPAGLCDKAKHFLEQKNNAIKKQVSQAKGRQSTVAARSIRGQG